MYIQINVVRVCTNNVCVGLKFELLGPLDKTGSEENLFIGSTSLCLITSQFFMGKNTFSQRTKKESSQKCHQNPLIVI